MFPLPDLRPVSKSRSRGKRFYKWSAIFFGERMKNAESSLLEVYEKTKIHQRKPLMDNEKKKNVNILKIII